MDENLDLKLGDFQGQYTDKDGMAREACAYGQVKASVPHVIWRSHRQSDLFAVGTVIYEIMTGHEPYPELDSIEEETIIEELYSRSDFPDLSGVLGQDPIRKCWLQQYKTAEECADDLKCTEAD